MHKCAEFNEDLESISTPSNDKFFIVNEHQGTSTTSQNIQVWLLYIFLSSKLVSINYSICLDTSKNTFIVGFFQ